MAHHRHQGHHAGAASDEQNGPFPAPDEVRGEWPAELDLVALGDDVVEVG